MLKARPDLRKVPSGPFSVRLPVPPSARDYWRVWRNRAVRTKEAEQYCAIVRASIGARALYHGELAIAVTWFREARRGDLDNRLKILLDALQGALYVNDCQVVELHAFRKEAPTDPHMLVMVEVRGP